MELSTEDKQRIEQWIEDNYHDDGPYIKSILKISAEYATRFEREKRKLWNDENNNLIKELGRRDGNIQQLEAENERLKKDGGEAYLNGFNDGASEQLTVRDKVIRECIDIIRAEGLSTANVLVELLDEYKKPQGYENYL